MMLPSEFHALCFFELKGWCGGIIVFQFVIKLPFSPPSPTRTVRKDGRYLSFVDYRFGSSVPIDMHEERAVKRITPRGRFCM